MRNITIYNGPGASEVSVQHAEYSLKRVLDHCTIHHIDKHGILEQSWLKDTDLFLMPGGADIPYCRKLNGEPNRIIRHYIDNGGRYFGICAGAYYACSNIAFDKGGAEPIVGKRELQFLPGSAIGPILAPYDFRSMSGARVATIKAEKTEEIISCFFNGGPYFKLHGTADDVAILAYYTNKEALNLPAIVKRRIGKGVALLSAVHLEYAPELLDEQDEYLKTIIPKLQNENATREAYFSTLLHQHLSLL